MEEQQQPSEESITYITMLSAFQVVLDCQLELKGTIYEHDKKVTQKVREAINMLNLANASNRNKIWKTDEIQAMKLSRSITRISGLIAKSDGVALSVIDSMLQEGIDFSKYKLVEI